MACTEAELVASAQKYVAYMMMIAVGSLSYVPPNNCKSDNFLSIYVVIMLLDFLQGSVEISTLDLKFTRAAER